MKRILVFVVILGLLSGILWIIQTKWIPGLIVLLLICGVIIISMCWDAAKKITE